MHRFSTFTGSTSCKLLTSVVAIGITASIASLGSWAAFTSSSSVSHDVPSGPVTAELGAVGTAAPRLNAAASNTADVGGALRTLRDDRLLPIAAYGLPTLLLLLVLVDMGRPRTRPRDAMFDVAQLRIDEDGWVWLDGPTAVEYGGEPEPFDEDLPLPGIHDARPVQGSWSDARWTAA